MFSKNKQRLLDAGVAREFSLQIVEAARGQRSAIDRRTTRHEGYRVSQRARKGVAEVFGWVKTVGGGRQLRYCGVARDQLWVEPDHRGMQSGALGQPDGRSDVDQGTSLS